MRERCGAVFDDGGGVAAGKVFMYGAFWFCERAYTVLENYLYIATMGSHRGD